MTTRGDDLDAVREAAHASRQLCAAIEAAIAGDEGVWTAIRTLLLARGGVGSAVQLFNLLERAATLLSEWVEGAVAEIVAEKNLSGIRRFFLEPQETYSIEDLASLWQISVEDVRDICHDELLHWKNRSSRGDRQDDLRITWADAVDANTRWTVFRPWDIEVALADDFVHVRSEGWRTVPILIRLPQFAVDAVTAAEQFPGSSLNIAVRTERFILDELQGVNHRDIPNRERRGGHGKNESS